MGLMGSLARFTHRRRWIVAAVFLATMVAAAVYGLGASAELTAGGYNDPSSESMRAADALEQSFGIRQPDVVVVYSHPRATFREPAFRDPLRRVLARLEAHRGVRSIGSPYDPGGADLAAQDGRSVMVTIELEGTEAQESALFDEIEPILRTPELTSRVGGPLPLERQAQESAERDLMRGELVTIPIVALLLIIFFRGVVAASLPLIVGLFSIGAALSCIRMLAHVTDVSTFAMNIVTFVGLGVAVDYSLFLVSRFREELAAGHPVPDAIDHTLQSAGRTIGYSGIVVAVSMLGLLAFPEVLLRSVALAGAFVVAMALTATLVFLPAALAILGPRIEMLRLGPRRLAQPSGRWRRIAHAVMRAPIAMTMITSAVLLTLGLPFLRIDDVVGGPGILPAGADAREVAEAMDAGLFPATVRTQLTVVLELDEPVLSRDGLGAVERWASSARRVSGVESVEAIVGEGAPLSPMEVLAMRDRLPPRLDAIVSGHRTLARVVASPRPGSDAAMDLVAAVRSVDAPGVHALVGGEAAQRLDLRQTIREGLPWAIAAICVVTFVVLFLAFGSFVVPLKAIVMNVLSLTASFGALVWIFQDGRLEWLLRYESTGNIELTIPVVMFAVMFGLAMDYELFLLSRIREEYDRYGDSRESVAFGIEQTGTIITRAALLLVAVMLGFISADMLLIKELGVGMAIAITIDVTIVRGLLVPATMQLLGDFNWWAPGPLARWWRRAGVGVDESVTSGPAEPAGGPA